jgi:hypothetical protein
MSLNLYWRPSVDARHKHNLRETGALGGTPLQFTATRIERFCGLRFAGRIAAEVVLGNTTKVHTENNPETRVNTS